MAANLTFKFVHDNNGGPVENLIWFDKYDNGEVRIGISVKNSGTVQGRETLTLEQVIELKKFLSRHIAEAKGKKRKGQQSAKKFQRKKVNGMGKIATDNDNQVTTGSVELVNYDCIYGSTIRVWIRINGILLKRIWDRSGRYEATWIDEEGKVGDTFAIQDPQKEKEIEAIFRAWCLEKKMDFVKMIQHGK